MWSGKRRLALSMALLLLLGGCGADTAQVQDVLLTGAEAQKVRSYKTKEVVTEDIVQEGSLVLRVDYPLQEPLYAPEDGVYLEEFLVRNSDEVKEGEPLASFRMDGSQAELEKARLAVKREKEDQEKELQKLQENVWDAWNYSGWPQGEIAQIQYDKKAYEFEQKLKALQEELDDQEMAAEPILLLAPCDCRVHSLERLDDQKVLDDSTKVMTITHKSSAVLKGSSGSTALSYGTEVELEYGPTDHRQTMSARVVSTSTLQQDGMMDVWIMPDDPVDVESLENPMIQYKVPKLQDVITVPASAIREENGKSYVRILVDGIPHRRYIVTGVSLGGEENPVLVLSGLEPGQQVILG